jgi:hypothetical protein
MSSKTYIIAWDGAIDNCLDIYNQLKDSGLDYKFHNVSSKDVDDETWVRTSDIRYYGHFHNALRDFVEYTDKDVFIFNAGDAEYADYVTYTKRIEDFFDKDKNIGIFAPSINFDPYSGDSSKIVDSVKHPELYLSTMPNGIYVALSREVATIMLAFIRWGITNRSIKIPDMVSGWGLDYIYSAVAIYLNKKIYRDLIEFKHPRTTHYNSQIADQEFRHMISIFKDYCPELGFDRVKIQTIFDLIEKKVRGKASFNLPIKTLYLNLKEDLDY